MRLEEPDIRDIILQSYILDILHELKTPKRFGELSKKIKTKRTLSTKLNKLRQYGLIEITPILVNNKYMNSYVISSKGKRVIAVLEKL